jgi:hypothetical protein
VPGAASAASAAPVTAAAPPITWQLCPDTEAGALVPLPAAAGTPAAILRLSRPLTGFHMTAELVHGSKGGDLLLVRLKAPPGARSGHYEGVLTVRRGPAVSQRRAEAEVLPFELMRPSKQFAVSRVPVSASDWRAPEEVGVAPLHELRALGIGALCLSALPADRAAIESTMRAAGLHGPVLAPVSSSGATLQAPGGPSGTPLPDHPPTSRAGTEAPQRGAGPGPGITSSPPLPSPAPAIRWYTLWTGGLPTAAAMAALKSSGTMLACPMQEGEAVSGVDLSLFDAAGAAGERLLHRVGTAGTGTPGWWHWDAGTATALENRLRCGALLWRSGLSGALVEIGPDAPASPDWPLRWEGVRQGVLDSRYLTTFFSLLRQLKDKDRTSPVPAQAEVAVAATLNGVMEHPSPEAVDRFRSLVVAWILKLGRMV